jgi:hypothetical protein
VTEAASSSDLARPRHGIERGDDVDETHFNGQTAFGGEGKPSIVVDDKQAVNTTARGATFSPSQDVKALSENMTDAVRSSDCAGSGYPIERRSDLDETDFHGKTATCSETRASISVDDAQGVPYSFDVTPALLKLIPSAEEAPTMKLVSMTSAQDSQPGMPVSDGVELSSPVNKMHCPYDWACPFISNELTDRKPLILLSLEASKPDLPTNPDEVESSTAGQIADIRQLLVDEWGDLITGEQPSDSLCTRIHKALQGTPLEWGTRNSRGIGLLRHRLRSRAWSAQSYGLAESIANDVGTAWREQSALLRKRKIEERNGELERTIAHTTSSFRELHRSWTALKELAMPRCNGHF